jgi:hypothetical protein
MARSKAQAAALRQVLLAAVTKYADKEYERDQLKEGSKHELALSVTGTIDAKAVDEVFSGTLTVGFDQETASSSACKSEQLVAWILDRYVDPALQLRLFDELPTLFDKHGGVPIADLEPGLVERCEALCKKLRAKTTITRKGNVTLNYTRGSDSGKGA